MKKLLKLLTLGLLSLTLLCSALPAAFAADSQEAKVFTIGLDAAGGKMSTVVVTTTPAGKLSALPESPTMEGYTFSGWYTEPVGGTKVTTSTVFNEDSTIYAHWTVKSGSTTPVTPPAVIRGGIQNHLGTLLVAGILLTLVVVAVV